MTLLMPEEAQGPGGHRAVLGRIVEAAGGDDHALAGHEPRRRGGGADGAGVREGDRGAHEVVGRDRALARARHEVVEGLRKAAKSSLPASLMLGTSRVRVPSFFCTSTATPRRTSSRWMRWAARLELGVGVVHAREGVEGPHDGPRHDVGEADLALARGVAMLVEDAPVLFEGAHREVAHRGRGGNGEARLHVLDDAQGAAADGLGDVAGKDGGNHHGLRLVAGEGRGLGPGQGALWPGRLGPGLFGITTVTGDDHSAAGWGSGSAATPSWRSK